MQIPEHYRVRIVRLDEMTIENECNHQLACGYVLVDQKFTPNGKEVILYFAEY